LTIDNNKNYKKMTTLKSFFRNFTAIATLILLILTTATQVQETNAQNTDQISNKLRSDFPSNFLKMDRSNPLAIIIDCQDYMFEINQATGVPLGSIEVGVDDSWAKDYSSYVGTTEFTINFDQNIIDYGKTVPSPDPARIGILELKDALGGVLQVRVDGGKTTLCFPLGYETGEEELRKLVQLVRTKDGRLAAMVTFGDKEGIFKSLYPGIRERICMVVPLQETTPAGSLKFTKDSEGNIFALLLLRDGKSRIKAAGTGKANLGVTVLTPSDKAMAEKIGMTLVVVN
jgi:hypothetical protein